MAAIARSQGHTYQSNFSEPYLIHVRCSISLKYVIQLEVIILKCTLTAKFVKCYQLKYWCPLIIYNGLLVLSDQASFMYSLISFSFISFTTCTNDLILMTLYLIVLV